jgi:hypothetical protein
MRQRWHSRQKLCPGSREPPPPPCKPLAAPHLPLVSSPCMLATYLKLGSASLAPGLSEISNTQMSAPLLALPMLRRGFFDRGELSEANTEGAAAAVGARGASQGRKAAAKAAAGRAAALRSTPLPHLNLRAMLPQRATYSSIHAALSVNAEGVWVACIKSGRSHVRGTADGWGVPHARLDDSSFVLRPGASPAPCFTSPNGEHLATLGRWQRGNRLGASPLPRPPPAPAAGCSGRS